MAGQPGEGGVGGEGPLEVLLVAAHGHQVGCRLEQLDHVGTELTAQRTLPAAEVPPAAQASRRGDAERAEQEDGQHQAAGRQDQCHHGHGDTAVTPATSSGATPRR